jgi:hypothetical protein
MTAEEAVYKAKNRAPLPQRRRSYNSSLLLDILNDTLKTIVIPDLFRIGGFFYLNDFAENSTVSLTVEDDTAYYDISSLTRLYSPSLAVWVCESSPSDEAEVMDDGYLVDIRGSNFTYDGRHYDMGYYRRKVLGTQDNATIWVFSDNYNYAYIKYIQLPEDYELSDTLDLDDTYCNGLLIPAIISTVALADPGFPTSGAWEKRYFRNLDRYEASIIKKIGAKRFRPIIRYHGQLGFKKISTGRYV